MEFYIVERVVEKGRWELARRFMCDNPKCPSFKTRGRGMPMEKAATGFTVHSMERFDACSPECQLAIRRREDAICEH